MKIKLKENAFYIGLIFLAFLGFSVHFLLRETLGLMYQFGVEGRTLWEDFKIVMNLFRGENGYGFGGVGYTYLDFQASAAYFISGEWMQYFGVVPGILLIRKNTGSWLFAFYREKSYRKFLFKKILSISLKFSGAIFLGFLLYMGFLGFLSNGHMLNFVSQPGDTGLFLFQFFSRVWISQHIFLYELMIAFFYFFLYVFVFAFFAQCVALFFSNVKLYFPAWILGCTMFSYLLSVVFGINSFIDEITNAFSPRLLFMLEDPFLIYKILFAFFLWLLVGGLLIFSQKKRRELGKGATLLRIPSLFETRRRTRLFVTKYRVIFGILLSMSVLFTVISVNSDGLNTDVDYFYISQSDFGLFFLILFLVFSYRDSGFMQQELSFIEKKRPFFIQKMLDYAKKWLIFLTGYGLLNLVFFYFLENTELKEANLNNLWVCTLVSFVFFNLLYLFVLSGIFKKHYFLLSYLLCLLFFSTERIYRSLPVEGITLRWSYVNPLASIYFYIETVSEEQGITKIHIHWLPYLCMIACYTALGIFTVWYRNRKMDIV